MKINERKKIAIDLMPNCCISPIVNYKKKKKRVFNINILRI